MVATTEQERQAFGAGLRRLRELRGWTPPELAGLVGKSGETIRQWEAGRWATDRRTVVRLEEILDAKGELLPLLGYGDEDTILRLEAMEHRLARLEESLRKITKLVERRS